MLPSRLICRLMPTPLAVVISVAFIVLPVPGPDRSRHHVVVRWFGDLLYDGAERMDRLHVEVEEPELSGKELAPRPTRSVIVLSCHATGEPALSRFRGSALCRLSQAASAETRAHAADRGKR